MHIHLIYSSSLLSLPCNFLNALCIMWPYLPQLKHITCSPSHCRFNKYPLAITFGFKGLSKSSSTQILVNSPLACIVVTLSIFNITPKVDLSLQRNWLLNNSMGNLGTLIHTAKRHPTFVLAKKNDHHLCTIIRWFATIHGPSIRA